MSLKVYRLPGPRGRLALDDGEGLWDLSAYLERSGRPTDLVELIDGAVAGETSRRSVSVDLRSNGTGEPTLQWVWPDGVRLAVGNVVRNAVVHGAPTNGGEARIDVTVDGTEVTVDDNGPGIPVDDRDRVLDRFEQGATTAGSGLGLAIARQVTKAHGGRIEISDSPLGGTRVRLRFSPPAPIA